MRSSLLDLQEKLIVPPILDCMINMVNHIKDCIAPRIAPYHVVVRRSVNKRQSKMPM
jgi:hypothetical protein